MYEVKVTGGHTSRIQNIRNFKVRLIADSWRATLIFTFRMTSKAITKKRRINSNIKSKNTNQHWCSKASASLRQRFTTCRIRKFQNNDILQHAFCDKSPTIKFRKTFRPTFFETIALLPNLYCSKININSNPTKQCNPKKKYNFQ